MPSHIVSKACCLSMVIIANVWFTVLAPLHFARFVVKCKDTGCLVHFVCMVNDLRLWKGDRSFITFLVTFWPLRFVTCRLKSVRQVSGLILRRCLSGASNDNCDTFYHCIAFSPPRKWKFFFSLLLTLSPFPAYNNYARHHQSSGAVSGLKLLLSV